MNAISALLIGGRVGGMVLTLPIFGGKNYPNIAKIGLVLALTVIIVPYANFNLSINLTTGWEFGLYLVNEVIIGLFLGMIASVFVGFIYFAGDFIDYLIGFSMVSVMNPLDETQMPVTTNLFYIFMNLVFLALNMHHKLIITMVESFQKIEVGSFIKGAESLSFLMSVVLETFVVGFSLAAPFIITVLVADIVLGLLSKAMPGMNIFILGMPFKILIGFFILIMILPLLADFMGSQVNHAVDLIRDYIFGVGGGS